MKELLQNKTIKILLIITGIIILLFLCYILSDILIILAISVLLAFIFNPFVLLLEKQGFNRFSSVLLIFLIVAFVLYLGLSFIIPRFGYQFNQLKETIHVYSLHDQIAVIEKDIYNILPFFNQGELAHRIDSMISSSIINFFNQISDVLTSIVSIVAILIIVPFITFFLLKDNRIIMQGLLNVMPNKYFEMSYWILKKITVQLGIYVRAWIFDASFVGILCGLGFYMIGINNAFPLGVIAGTGHLVPYFGPIIGGIPAIIISIIQYGDLSHVPFILLLIICVYTIDNGIIQPFIFSKSLNMHPVVIILLIIAGSQLFGIIGMLLAIPVATVFKTALKEIYFAYKNYKIARL